MVEDDNEVVVSLTLTSAQHLPGEVTALTGLQPTRTWMMNDLIAGTLRRYQMNGWSLESGLDSKADLDEHIAALMRVIDSVAAFRDLADRWEIELNCAIYAKVYTPPCHLDRELIRRLAAIGAQVDIDFYCLCL